MELITGILEKEVEKHFPKKKWIYVIRKKEVKPIMRNGERDCLIEIKRLNGKAMYKNSTEGYIIYGKFKSTDGSFNEYLCGNMTYWNWYWVDEMEGKKLLMLNKLESSENDK